MVRRSARCILILMLAGGLLTRCGTASPPLVEAPTAVPAPSSSSPTSTSSATAPVAVEEIRSERPRADVQAPEGDLGALTAGNAAFALDLYQALGQEDGNLFFSPHSISLALAMTYAGAASTTAEQMRATLHFTLPDERLHAAFNALDAELTDPRASDPNVPEESRFTLRQANALWGQQGYAFRPAFLDLLAEHYGAGLNVLDFAAEPEPSRERINTWVEEQTEQKIQELLPEGSVTSATRLVLTNAIYFNAKWIAPFDPNATHDGPFTRMDGTEVTVPLMNLTHSFRYTDGPDFQAVQLDYHGDVAMIVLLPAKDRFQDFDAALTAEQLQDILDDLAPRDVWLRLPTLDYTSETLRLQSVLQGLGMVDAFMPGQADFSGIDGTRSFAIGEVFHKAAVIVDEEGTEAAAATAVGLEGAAGPPEPPIEMHVDRPFILLIRDNRTGALLFVGRIVDPQQ